MLSCKARKQRGRNPRFLRSEWFRFLCKLREVTERESGEGITAMKVSGSLSLVGVSGGAEGSMVGETRESGEREGSMVGETSESGGGEGSMVGEIEGSMGVDPCRELDAGGREVLGSEFDSEAEDDTDMGSESPIKKCKIDPPPPPPPPRLC